MTEENKQTEVSTIVNTESRSEDDFWNSGSGDSSVDAVADVLVESVKEDDLEEEKKVEESDLVSEPIDKTEEAKETDKDDYTYKYKSHKEAEDAYRDRQAAADAALARVTELEGQQVDQGKLTEMLAGLNDVLADVDDPTVQAAIQKLKEAAGQTVLDRERVDPKAATEIEKHIQAQNDRIARLEEGHVAKSEEDKVAEAKAHTKQIESEYPYAATIKNDAEALLAQHKKGELDDDEIVLKLAEIGWKASQSGKVKTKTIKKRSGSDAGGTPGKIDSGEKKKVSDAEVLTDALVGVANSRDSYV